MTKNCRPRRIWAIGLCWPGSSMRRPYRACRPRRRQNASRGPVSHGRGLIEHARRTRRPRSGQRGRRTGSTRALPRRRWPAPDGSLNAVLAVLARDCLDLCASPDKNALHWCADSTCTRPFIDRSRGQTPTLVRNERLWRPGQSGGLPPTPTCWYQRLTQSQPRRGRFARNGYSFCGSVSGQLGDDRSERISGVGADDEVGEAALLPSSQDFFGRRRRVTGSTRSESTARSAAGSGVGGCHERGDGVADHRHVEREFDVSNRAEIGPPCAGSRPASRRPAIAANVTVSARVDRQRPGLRTAHGHHHRCMEVRTVEVSERGDSVTHLGQPLAWCHHRKAQLAHFVFDPGSPGAMPISKRPSVSTDSECASHAKLLGGRSGEAYTTYPPRQFGGRESPATASVGPGAGCHCRTSGISNVE